MTTYLGTQARTARKARGWSLADMCDMLRELEAGDITPSTLKRMEDGTRPGDARVWGKIWRVLKLPLRDLYEGLGLPVPGRLPAGTVGEILELVRPMPEESRRLVLSFARSAPSMLEVALLGFTTPEPDIDRPSTDAAKAVAYPEREAPEAPWTRAAEERRDYESPQKKQRS
jgi:transcriptional regulator with XRE-family HTH domain